MGVTVVFLPVALLLTAILRSGGNPQPILVGGFATVAFLAIGLLYQIGAAGAAGHKYASPLYLITVFILWLSTKDYQDIFLQAAMGVLLGVPLLQFVFQEMLLSKGNSQRRARSLVRRLADKTDWPADLADCKTLPEVKALRQALNDNAEPAMVLLMHPNPQVRIAALAALEFRPSWQKGQAEKILQAAKFATEPSVRVAAMMALANVDDPRLATLVAVYLRDATREVRKAAAEALLWDAENRWSLIRRELRTTLSDPRCLDDGALPCSSGLPDRALTDLILWAGEAGPIGHRATMTLLGHYRRELNESPTTELIDQLGRRIADSKVPSALRVELAHLLVEQDAMNPDLWRSLLQPEQPSALRLLAAGALLQSGQDELALETLREVAHTPNREMALQVAAIIQKCLRIDMGMPLGGLMPDAHSKQAAEIACRVMDWTRGKSRPIVEERVARRTRYGSLPRKVSKPVSESPRRRI